MADNNQRMVSVSISMAVPEILTRLLMDRVELTAFEQSEIENMRDEGEVLFYMRIYRKYHQDADFKAALDRMFLNASTQRRKMWGTGTEAGTARLYDYSEALCDFEHPVIDECRKGLELPYDLSKKEKDQSNG